MPLLRHYDGLGTSRFITFCCYHRFQLLRPEKIKSLFIECLKLVLDKYDIKIFGYVLMPEHVHLVLLPPDNIKLGRIIGQLKSKSALASIAYMKISSPESLRKITLKSEGILCRAFWQKRCYDHNCRTNDTTIEKINYCHKNPVIRGLVQSPGNWTWSSYNWYNGKRDVPIQMDDLQANLLQ